MTKTFRIVCALVVVLAAFVAPRSAHAERIRDLADVAGARENQLVGYGLVTGLAGTGDDASVPFTSQSVLSMLRRLGVQVDSPQVRLRNVAAVIVTSSLPAFAKPGTKVDVTVSSIGNAKALTGGVLIQTMLKGADQKTYAVAQGPLLLGGFEGKGASGSSVKQGTLTTARVPEGALVEREVATAIVDAGALRLELRGPGFGTAARIAEAVNKRFAGAASAADGGSVRVKVPDGYTTRIVELVAALEDIEVVPVRRSRVIINERSGTIVAGGDVRLAASAVVHGALTIVVKEQPVVSQPTAPLSKGTTAVVPQSEVTAHDPKQPVVYVPPAATLADVAAALGTLGLSPRELGSVLMAMRAAGAIEAEVVVQ